MLKRILIPEIVRDPVRSQGLVKGVRRHWSREKRPRVMGDHRRVWLGRRGVIYNDYPETSSMVTIFIAAAGSIIIPLWRLNIERVWPQDRLVSLISLTRAGRAVQGSTGCHGSTCPHSAHNWAQSHLRSQLAVRPGIISCTNCDYHLDTETNKCLREV